MQKRKVTCFMKEAREGELQIRGQTVEKKQKNAQLLSSNRLQNVFK